jgi:hypothetical protein
VLVKKSPQKPKVQKELVKSPKIEGFTSGTTHEKIKKEKVELVDLEKKLEEILGE